MNAAYPERLPNLWKWPVRVYWAQVAVCAPRDKRLPTLTGLRPNAAC